MPELPEVETICRTLRPHLLGKRIALVEVLEPRLRARVDQQALSQLAGRSVEQIDRLGKYILISLSGDLVWMFHLGMSGKMIYTERSAARRKHDHIIAHLNDGGELRYHDSRRFGISLVAEREHLQQVPQLRNLGIDPLGSNLTGEYLFGFTRASARRIRDLLLDQQIVAGLGNIYANEVLFRSGIKPVKRARRLTLQQARELAAKIPRLLQQAVQRCGTSFSDYRDAEDRRGEFQNHLRVYDREGEPCRLCSTRIKRVAIGNRSAFYCPKCQR